MESALIPHHQQVTADLVKAIIVIPNILVLIQTMIIHTNGNFIGIFVRVNYLFDLEAKTVLDLHFLVMSLEDAMAVDVIISRLLTIMTTN